MVFHELAHAPLSKLVLSFMTLRQPPVKHELKSSSINPRKMLVCRYDSVSRAQLAGIILCLVSARVGRTSQAPRGDSKRHDPREL